MWLRNETMMLYRWSFVSFLKMADLTDVGLKGRDIAS